MKFKLLAKNIVVATLQLLDLSLDGKQFALADLRRSA
jgi:hypothetical protein